MATNSPRRWRRRTYIVDRAFQWKFAASFAIIVFLLSSAMGTILYGALHQQARARLINPETYSAEVTTVVLLSGVAFAGITSAAVLLWGLLVSHRICGPLWLIAGYFRELANGRLPNLRPLRKKDEFKDFYADFCKAIDFLKESKRAQLATLSEALSLARSAGDADEDTRKRTLESLASRLQTLRRETAEALGETNDEVAGETGKSHRHQEVAVTVG